MQKKQKKQAIKKFPSLKYHNKVMTERQDMFSMTKKGHISINLGQFEDETSLNSMQI